MKFAIFLQHYFPYGGLQRDSVRLARAAIEAGDEPHLIVSTWDGPKPEGVQVTELDSGGASNHSKAARFAHDCQNMIQAKDFDSSICFSRVPGSAFQFCGDPCFADKFARNKPSLLRWLPRYRFLLENEAAIFAADSPTHLFFLAASEIPAYQNHYEISPERMTLLPPWLKKAEVFDETREEIKAQTVKALNLSAETNFLLFVGSDFQRKGLDLIIQALADMEDTSYHLLVCGQCQPGECQKIAEQLDVAQRVHFLGPRDDVPRLMTAASLLVHPARQETAGMVLLEALTYGLPVLCTENCGYATHVQDAGCPVLKAGINSTELSERIVQTIPLLPSLSHQAQAWSDDPSRYNTSDLILQTMRDSV